MSSEPPEKNKPQPEETNQEPAHQSITASGGSTIQNAAQVNVSGEVKGDVVVNVGKSETEELNNYLDWAVTNFENRMSGLVYNAPLPKEPFKSLNYFRIQDTQIFFGRETVTQELFDSVMANRLIILYARSGAGKSSILNAGLSPVLVRANWLPVYVRAHEFQENLVREIKQAIFPPSLKPWPRLLEQLTLLEVLGLVGMKRQNMKELVIILDQFEQFLISLPNKEIHQSFFEILRDCYEDPNLPVRFIISLKHENLWNLDDLEQFIPGILQNRFRLLPMSEVEVRKAITGPVQKVNEEITFEPALLDQLVQELGGKNVELTHLQIVCSQLYSKLPKGEKIITTRLYEEQGRVKEILSTYLDKTLEPLSQYKQQVARDILVELVSSEGTNHILGLPDFEPAVMPDPKVIEDVLEYLVNNRLLRRDMDSDASRYELAHDYLAEEVSHLVGPQLMETKKAEDLLRRELANHRIFQTRIDPEKLKYLRAYLRFRSLDDAARKLLFESSLEHAQEVGFWVNHMPDPPAAARVAASAALENHKIAESLQTGLAENLRAEVLPVLWEAYHQSDPVRRQQAAEALWILEDWLSPQQKSQIKWALRRVQVQKTMERSSRPALAVAAFFLIPLLIRLFFFVAHPIPGNWVPIPAGPFIMGMDQKEADYAHQFCMDGALKTENCLDAQQLLAWSGRQKNATLGTYSIMDNEVTFAQYRQCVEDGTCEELPVAAAEQGMNLPATQITWPQAETYCEWLGGRLPTEAEWEKAARGSDGNYYPWGSTQEWDKTRANIEHYDEKEGVVAEINVFSKSDLSEYGVKNMAGNVEEWTASECMRETCFKKNGQAFSNPVLTLKAALVKVDGPARRVIVKGGSWLSARSVGMGSVRQPFDLNNAWYEIGFRCACPAGVDCKSPWDWWRIWPAQN